MGPQTYGSAQWKVAVLLSPLYRDTGKFSISFCVNIEMVMGLFLILISPNYLCLYI